MAMDPGFSSSPVRASTPAATPEEIERFRTWARSVVGIRFLDQRDPFEHPNYDAIADELTAKLMAFPDRGRFPLPEIGFKVVNNVNTNPGSGSEPDTYTFSKQVLVWISSLDYAPEPIAIGAILTNVLSPLGLNRRNLRGLQDDILVRLKELVKSVRDAVDRCKN